MTAVKENVKIAVRIQLAALSTEACAERLIVNFTRAFRAIKPLYRFHTKKLTHAAAGVYCLFSCPQGATI